MTWKDKLEIGLEDDAAFRKDNLPESQVRGEVVPTGPGRSPEVPAARNDHNEVVSPADEDGQTPLDVPVSERGIDPDEPSVPGEATRRKQDQGRAPR